MNTEQTRRYEELLPAEMEAAVAAAPIAYVPSGTLEWHSLHLPLGLDGLKAHALCEGAAARAGGVVVPTTYWAIGGMPHPWTTRMNPTLIEALFADIYGQLAHVGFRVILALAGHYSLEHYLALKRAAVKVMGQSGLTILPFADFEFAVDAGYRGDHAARWETSLLWSVRPDLVALDRLPPDGPLDGVLGEDPRTLANPDEGARVRDLIVERMAAMAQRALRQPALHRSAYLEALAMQIRVMEAIAAERRAKPKHVVPTLLTEDYLRLLDALREGDYRAATAHGADALARLTRT